MLKVDLNDTSAVPNYINVQRLIERKLKKNAIPLSTPTTFTEIEIPAELKLTNADDSFLLYDNENHDSRIIGLSSGKDMTRLSACDRWHVDGTFKVS